MPIEVPTAQEKPNFKITTKVVWNELENKSRAGRKENGQKVKATGTGNESAKSLKRKPEVPLDGQRGKETKTGSSLKILCRNILKELLLHKYSFIFSEPVDPVKLNIPDYFSIISKPMDLGTIKQKLESNMYFSADDFAADVRLTFSNATRYNPEGNMVHTIAKEIHGDFCRRWKSLEGKLKQMKEIDDRGSFVESNATVAKEGVGDSMPDPKPICLDKENIGSSPGDKKLWKLRTEVSSMDATCEKGITISFSLDSGFNTVKTFEFCCEGIL